MNLLLHPVAERAVNQLVLLDHVLSAELRADNDSAKMMAIVPFHMHEFARKIGFNMIFYALCCNHALSFPLFPLGEPLNPAIRRSSYLCEVPETSGESCNLSSTSATLTMIRLQSRQLQSRGYIGRNIGNLEKAVPESV